MTAWLNKHLFSFISKKLFSFFVVVGVTLFCAVWGYEVPEAFYWFSASYVGGQSFVDGFAKIKGA